jgi:flavodoxin
VNDTETPTSPPRVLFVYFTYTQQAQKIVDTMSEVFTERGIAFEHGLIGFPDKRYAERFESFPMPHPFRELIGMIPAELRRATGEIVIPKEVGDGDYDLVVVGSPTWWLSTSVPIRSFLESDEAGALLKGKKYATFVVCRRYYGHNIRTVKKLAKQKGAEFVDSIKFTYDGGQIRSLLSLVSFLGKGKQEEKYMGVKIPPTNLRPHHLDEAREFAGKLADGLK